jgi:hypothetical protein
VSVVDEAARLPRLVALRRGDGTIVQDAVLQLSNDRLVWEVLEVWVPLLAMMATDDAGWPWARKTIEVCYPHGVQHVMITHEDEVQGILITSLPEERPSLSALDGLVYVERVASAPWNRARAAGGQRYRGVGRVLLAHAVHRSRSEHRGGSIGLHSERGAVTYYEREIELSNRGWDAGEELDYFEGDASWADVYLSRRR